MTLLRHHGSSESLGLLCGKCQSRIYSFGFYVLMNNVKLTIHKTWLSSSTMRKIVILSVVSMLSSGFTLLTPKIGRAIFEG
jgi:hypothetical protein